MLLKLEKFGRIDHNTQVIKHLSQESFIVYVYDKHSLHFTFTQPNIVTAIIERIFWKLYIWYILVNHTYISIINIKSVQFLNMKVKKITSKFR